MLEIILMAMCFRAKRYFKVAGKKGIGGYGWKIWGWWLLMAIVFTLSVMPGASLNLPIPGFIPRLIILFVGYKNAFGLAFRAIEEGKNLQQPTQGDEEEKKEIEGLRERLKIRGRPVQASGGCPVEKKEDAKKIELWALAVFSGLFGIAGLWSSYEGLTGNEGFIPVAAITFIGAGVSSVVLFVKKGRQTRLKRG